MKTINKIIFPHAFILGASLLLGIAVFSAMISTNNNGEFGYPDQGIYIWREILPILLTWMVMPIIIFESLFLIYKFINKIIITTPNYLISYEGDVQEIISRNIRTNRKIYIPILLIILTGGLLSYLFWNPLPAFCSVALLFFMYNAIQRKSRSTFMKQFALGLGYTYSSQVDSNSLDGYLFTTGSYREINDVINISDNNFIGRIFVFTSLMGYERYIFPSDLIVFETTFSINIPNIICQNKNFEQLFIESNRRYYNDKKRVYISLEDNFNKIFVLSTEKGSEESTRKIFTPEFIENLLKLDKDFGFEFHQNRLYIYGPFMGTKKSLNGILSSWKKLVPMIEYQVKSIQGASNSNK